MSPTLYLGIDTGGTFTDGVLLNAVSRRVVKKAKVLTTHHDLSICISSILDALIADEGEAIRLVSLSTTLATNSIAEGKSRPVALFLLGYDSDLVYKFEFDRQLGEQPPHFIRGRHDMNGNEIEPLDIAHLEHILSSLDGQVEAVAISSYAAMRNSAHEEEAAQLASRLTHLPVVQGHQLSDNLDSIRRATTTRLNASLLSTAYDFMRTVETILRVKGIACPLYVIKGDGSLASSAYVAGRPVEMIHSGPATSAIGGSYLAGTDSALVIDVGGTTTDLALTGQGSALPGDGEATVGEYRTALHTVRSHSFGLGGDSLIRFTPNGGLRLGPERAVPLSYLSHENPAIRQDLQEWLAHPPLIWYSDHLEIWSLRRLPAHTPSNPKVRKALEILKAGPIRMRKLLKMVGAVSPFQLSVDSLVREEIITRAGLTPTDLLHATGEFSPWDADLAKQLVQACAYQWGISSQEFIQMARDVITRRIAAEILEYLSGASLAERDFGFTQKDLPHYLFDEALLPTDRFLGIQFQLKIPMVGIGAPARAFLPPVARAFHTEICFPEHYEVANAVGTVVGNIFARQVGEVLPWVEEKVQHGYYARVAGVQRSFANKIDALNFARELLSASALEEARSAGAIALTLGIEENELPGDMIRLVAHAAGKPA